MSIITKPDQGDQMLDLIKTNIVQLFCNGTDTPYAQVRMQGRLTTIPIHSSDMDNYINGTLYRGGASLPNKELIEKFKAQLSAIARFDNPKSEIAVRVSRTKHGIELDLNNDEGQCVLINEKGWIIQEPTAFFVRPKSMQSLPLPKKGGSLEIFKSLFNTANDEELRLLLVCLSYNLNNTGPYPILTFKGPEGSGKSTCTRLCKRLIDPSLGEDRAAPENERDMFIAAKSEHLYAIDNLSSLTSKQSDAFCRLVTAASYGRKKNYTDEDEHLIKQCKPVVLNGITDLAKRPDLISRTVLISLRSFDQRRDEKTFWAEFERNRPFLLGYILDLTHAALKNYYDVNSCSSLRLADLDRWGRAIERGLGWGTGTFTNLLEGNQSSTLETALSNDPVATAILSLINKQGNFVGTASELLEALNSISNYEGRGKGWPSNPNFLAATLNRLEVSFAKMGIEYINHLKSGLSNRTKKVIILRSLENETVQRSATMSFKQSPPPQNANYSSYLFDE